MTDIPLPASIDVPLSSLINLAVEHWRLTVAVGASASAPARHALRKMDDFLRANGIEIQSMDGKPFDPGLAVRVVDTIDDPAFPLGKSVIAETLSPMVLYRGRVVKPADVVTRGRESAPR